MKRHSWKKPDVMIYKNHRQCRNCDLQKALNSKGNFASTYYFEMNKECEIISGGETTILVPYGCGDKKITPKFLLEDELFEI